jgi:hypothetical protein
VSSIATKCLDDLLEKIKKVPLIENKKTFYVYSEADLLDETKSRTLPCVGVMYGGLRAVEGRDGKGLSSMCRAILVVVAENKDIGKLDRKNLIVQLLDDMRDQIKETRSPTGHFWQFLGENPAPMIGNRIVYLQNWQTPTLLS